MKYGLCSLFEAFGCKTSNDFIEEYGADMLDGLSPAICPNCGYTAIMEPDQDRGWCEECNTSTVIAAPVLLGII